MILIDGKKYRDELLEEYKKKVEDLSISLAIIQVGNNEASNLYITNKIKYSSQVGINVEYFNLDTEDEKEVEELINQLNENDNITGIILQSPTPNMNYDRLAEMIDSKKDVDGFTKENIYKLYMKEEAIIPCTVKGIIKLLDHYNIPISGSNICIIGRGNIVGKPLALALTNRDATVTLCHSKTKKLKDITKKADIIISAVGKPNMITEDMVKKDFVGIDVGINKVNGKTVGDFDFENIKDKASYITPVPGGVGPMTIAMIIDNLIEMAEKN
ncbi:MAG: bifunctional 5,10-methylenetetrahydrofolate dehydrogenase/5,10-methenyltetrahydrofolate cyclohydrolase [Bacilli bacterium]|nr:bifunctional 5,10-methylenetetrahydrofolate dehydrogenase/5,10-methenyltetrahydrofolate cyclohydrolase [Bacilli bacterium]